MNRTPHQSVEPEGDARQGSLPPFLPQDLGTHQAMDLQTLRSLARDAGGAAAVLAGFASQLHGAVRSARHHQLPAEQIGAALSQLGDAGQILAAISGPDESGLLFLLSALVAEPEPRPDGRGARPEGDAW